VVLRNHGLHPEAAVDAPLAPGVLQEHRRLFGLVERQLVEHEVAHLWGLALIGLFGGCWLLGDGGVAGTW
jgi:hypothetical protein